MRNPPCRFPLEWTLGQLVLNPSTARERRPFVPPGTPLRFARERPVLVRHSRIEVAVDVEAKRVRGTVTHRVAAVQKGVTSVELDAVEMAVSRVWIEGDGDCRFDLSPEKLRVFLPRPLGAGDEATISIRYSARPRKGLYFIAPDEAYPDKPLQAWSQGEDEDNRSWFPCADAPNQKATTEVIVTAAKRFRTLSNGRLVSVADDGENRRWHWSLATPHSPYLVTLVVGEFDEITEHWDGIPIQYLVPKGRAAEGRVTLGRTPEMMAFFSERLGARYPYEKYAQVFVEDFMWGGMENTSATTLTDQVLHDETIARDYDCDDLVSHELAHQWFGDLLTCRDWAHLWLNEGFATYFQLLYREQARGTEELTHGVLALARAYVEEDAEYRRPIVAERFRAPLDLFDRHSYNKAALVLHALRGEIGDDAFWASMRHYVRTHRERNVETGDFRRAVEEVTGKSLQGFFRQWFHHGGHPELKVAYAWDEARGEATLAVSQTQAEEAGTPDVFRLRVPVEFVTSAGTHREVLELTEREHRFAWKLPTRPRYVRFDPGAHALAVLDFPLAADMAAAQLAEDPDIAGRTRAAGELAKNGSVDAIEALAGAVRADPFWGGAAAAAAALGRIRTPEARAALVANAAHPHPRVRRAVARALGEFRDLAACRALLPLAERDASVFVRMEAALSAGKTRRGEAFDPLVRLLRESSWNEILRQGAAHGLAALGDERAISPLKQWTEYGKPMHARAAAARALAHLGEEKREVREHLVAMLDDPTVRMRMYLLEALETLGDRRVIPELRRMAERELDDRVKRIAERAVESLQQQRSPRASELERGLDALRDEFAKMKERLEKAEQGTAVRPAPPKSRTTRAKRVAGARPPRRATRRNR